MVWSGRDNYPNEKVLLDIIGISGMFWTPSFLDLNPSCKPTLKFAKVKFASYRRVVPPKFQQCLENLTWGLMVKLTGIWTHSTSSPYFCCWQAFNTLVILIYGKSHSQSNLKHAALLVTVSAPWTMSAVGLDEDLFHLLATMHASWRSSFEISHSELRCESYTRSKW